MGREGGEERVGRNPWYQVKMESKHEARTKEICKKKRGSWQDRRGCVWLAPAALHPHFASGRRGSSHLGEVPEGLDQALLLLLEAWWNHRAS